MRKIYERKCSCGAEYESIYKDREWHFCPKCQGARNEKKSNVKEKITKELHQRRKEDRAPKFKQ